MNPEPMNKKVFQLPNRAHLPSEKPYFRSWAVSSKPQDDPVYAFIDKKRAQGKPYYVYMTAGANKFLRIYYGRVKEYLMSLPE